MNRRTLLRSLGIAAAGAVVGHPRAFAQPGPVPRRVALLTVETEASFASSLHAFRAALREHGHVEGRDVALDVRYGGGRAQDLPRLAADLAALRPAVFVATGKQATDAALAADGEVAIVSIGDLVAAGHAAELGRPGGRVTGVSFLPVPLNAKRLAILADLLPKGSAVLNLADVRPLPGAMETVEAAGRALGLVMHAAYARTPQEIEAAFGVARALRVAGINVLNSPFLSAEYPRIIKLAARARMPAIYQWPETAGDGGLMGYGPSLALMFRHLAQFASRIVNGAKPGDLPIEQPTRFVLAINLGTARALPIVIPPSLLLRADEVLR